MCVWGLSLQKEVEWDGLVPIPFISYALLLCLIVNLLLTKTLSDSRFYVSSYYLGLFIHVGMGRLGDTWQVLILVAHADDDEDEQEALHTSFLTICTGCSAVISD